MESTHHYPPEVMNIIGDTIPRLCRSKWDVLTFFRGAGVPERFTKDYAEKLRADKSMVSKFEMSKTILRRLNDEGMKTLGLTREIIKRIVEFEDFSTCWPSDQLEAKGLVASLRTAVDRKDSFTRMSQEKELEKKERIAVAEAKVQKQLQIKDTLSRIKDDLFSCFRMTNPQERGKKLEGVLNRLFKVHGILIKEDFTVRSEDGRYVYEQIDGAIEVDGHVYLVEMKWWEKPLGTNEVAPHIVRVSSRGQCRGLLISSSGFTEPAIHQIKETLRGTVTPLCELAEIVRLLELDGNLTEMIRKKARAAQVDKLPLLRVYE